VTRDYATSKVLAKALLGIYFPETLQRLVYATPIDRQIESFVGTIKEIEGALKLNTKEVAALVDKLSKVGIVFQSLPAGVVEVLPGSGELVQASRKEMVVGLPTKEGQREIKLVVEGNSQEEILTGLARQLDENGVISGTEFTLRVPISVPDAVPTEVVLRLRYERQQAEVPAERSGTIKPETLAKRVDERIDPKTDCLSSAGNLFPVYAAEPGGGGKPCPVWERLVVKVVEKGEKAMWDLIKWGGILIGVGGGRNVNVGIQTVGCEGKGISAQWYNPHNAFEFKRGFTHGNRRVDAGDFKVFLDWDMIGETRVESNEPLDWWDESSYSDRWLEGEMFIDSMSALALLEFSPRPGSSGTYWSKRLFDYERPAENKAVSFCWDKGKLYVRD